MKSRKILSIILAAALTLGSAATSTAFAANPSSGPSAGIDLPNMSDLKYSWQYADVTASATVGGEPLSDNKVILSARDQTVTIVVPDNNTADVGVTITCPATTNVDDTTRQLIGTSESVQKEVRISLMDGEKYTPIEYHVLVVEESAYVPHTLNISAEGCSHIIDGKYGTNYTLTTQKTPMFANSLSWDLVLKDGDTVLPGTKIYICYISQYRSCHCDTRIDPFSIGGGYEGIQFQYPDGRTEDYTWFFMPDHAVNFTELHTQTYSVHFDLTNPEHGTVTNNRSDFEFNESTVAYRAEGRTFELTAVPDEGYSAVVTAEDADGNSIDVTKGEDNEYTFEMPAKEVNVTVEFVELPPSDPDDTSKPTTSEPGTSEPTTSEPSTSTPSTSAPSTSTPSTSTPSTSTPSESTPAATEKVFQSTLSDATLSDPNLDYETRRVLDGITVTDTNGAFEDGVVMNVKPVQATSGFSFDITFTKDGKEVQPNGSVTVKVPVPEMLKGQTIYVYHVENGRYVLVNSEVKDGFVIFSADHFSEYILSAENLNANSEPSDSTSTPTAPDKGNPSTGIAVSTVPVLIAAGAAAVIISNKKK